MAKETKKADRWLTVKQVAQAMRLSEGMVRRCIAGQYGKPLPHEVIVRRSVLERWIDERSEGGSKRKRKRAK